MKLGVAWYAEAEWQRLRQVAADPEVLEATYADWLKVVEKSLRELVASDVVAERVDVTVAELQQWCEQLMRRAVGRTCGAVGAEPCVPADRIP